MKRIELDKKKTSVVLSLVAMNLIIGSLVAFLKLPVYLDSLGIVLATIILGWRYGVTCAVLTVAFGFFLINPYLPFYVLTSIGIVIVTNFLNNRFMFASYSRAFISGLIIAVVSAILSAPVSVFFFQGSTLSGSDAITAYFLSTGKTIIDAVLLSGFSSEPVDKVIVALASHVILKAVPTTFLVRNGFNGFKVKNP